MDTRSADQRVPCSAIGGVVAVAVDTVILKVNLWSGFLVRTSDTRVWAWLTVM